MRLSRLFTATEVRFRTALGIALIAALPGCSSSSDGSSFEMDAGNPTTLDASLDGADGAPDATKPRDAKGKDAPMSLGTPDAPKTEASTVTEAGFNDAKLHFEATTCSPDASGPGPVKHVCIVYPSAANDDMNECDGHHDPGPPELANGGGGNGFDDNCNGLVDEGCACAGVGTTKTCYLVPATQTVDGLPVGWCAQNSKGTVACAQQGEGAPTWDGLCRGAQPPYADDFCAPGDFNCDGKQENSTAENCSCTTSYVQCPSMPVETVPYPPPSALPLEVNAAKWFTNPADVPNATDWQWTLTGGDCDNILAHPTFGIYPTSDGTGDPIGIQDNALGTSGKQHGIVATAPAVSSGIYPAFSLSGEYVLNASWSLYGKPYTCSVKVEVKAPGIRAEGCWDTEGQGNAQGLGDDLDLHMAKINDFPKCSTSHAWSDLSCSDANEDCYYADCYGGSGGFGETDVDWGYVDSPASACSGWGSQSSGVSSCPNPRLDRDANGDSGPCDPTITNPNASSDNPFCGPENINVDEPKNNDRFAVALHFYARHDESSVPVHAHVNIYCDGVRVLSSGYDPVAGNLYPQLLSGPGGDADGDTWKVALVTTQVTGAGLNCVVDPTQSKVPHGNRDGSTSFCVDNSSLDGEVSLDLLTSTGLEPASANALCYH